MKRFKLISINLQNSNGVYYVGMTANLNRRLSEHQRPKSHISRYNKNFKLVYQETYTNKNEAAMRENQIKGWSRAKKEALVQQDFKRLSQLSKKRNSLQGRG